MVRRTPYQLDIIPYNLLLSTPGPDPPGGKRGTKHERNKIMKTNELKEKVLNKLNEADNQSLGLAQYVALKALVYALLYIGAVLAEHLPELQNLKKIK